ncbi:hypothetical protein [Streptomyces sp. NBC_01294]|uniref:hypothetical protein n=1 Tax=Streptomyces sp. NBC_01294 TaxID=2903815 RepID=UPI002DDA6B2E|nr:hypothetical protein [Streptomyces sp. NBC_01294]WRZ62365.1 hypothetical protein OG534_37960 [Streptomyces sp. NBC_01294]
MRTTVDHRMGPRLNDHVRAHLERLRRSGATLHLTRTKARTIASAPWLFLRHTTGRQLPYFLPAGGSAPIGTLGYAEVALELAAQVADGTLPEPRTSSPPSAQGVPLQG